MLWLDLLDPVEAVERSLERELGLRLDPLDPVVRLERLRLELELELDEVLAVLLSEARLPLEPVLRLDPESAERLDWLESVPRTIKKLDPLERLGVDPELPLVGALEALVCSDLLDPDWLDPDWVEADEGEVAELGELAVENVTWLLLEGVLRLDPDWLEEVLSVESDLLELELVEAIGYVARVTC